MAILLGVDTGGTYTDAVLLQDEKAVLAKSKALTTRHNLAQGVGNAIDAVLQQSGVKPADIGMASLSTTLATNALVEGQGGRVALVFIGFSHADLKRHGLEDALKGDPVIFITGGHSHAGAPIADLGVDQLKAGIAEIGPTVSAFAVASQFATRNPAHEVQTREILREMTGKPVSCSHDLTSKLNGPKRAMTAVLNARLIGMIDHLISSSENLLKNRGIDAHLMVVRGDGALISAEMARERPIETILSGPAASIVGARWLTDEADAIVSDIGGTTTDVAVLRGGRPLIDPMGARVGQFRTMVEAVAMRTTGLGGDSQVHMASSGLKGRLSLGPRRVMPIALCAHSWPELVHAALDKTLQNERIGELDGHFIIPIHPFSEDSIGFEGLSAREVKVMSLIGDEARTLSSVVSSRMGLSAIQRLISRGLVMMSALTPSDACHVLGRLEAWDAEAALKAVQVFGMQRTGAGERLDKDAHSLAQRIVDQLTRQTSETLLEIAFAEEAQDFGLPPEQLARHVLTQKGLSHHRGILAIDLGLNLPVIGLGASAANYYGAVGKVLRTKMILPEHADVANALGAVVGQVSMKASGIVTSPSEGKYRVHFQAGPKDFSDPDQALDALEAVLRDQAQTEAHGAGSQDIRVAVSRDIKTSNIEAHEVFIEAEVIATATGRPRIAD